MKRLPRLLLTLALLALPATTLWAQTTVNATPGTCANVGWGTGSENWGNVDEAEVQDDDGATVAVDDNEVSEYLRCTGYGFSIPAGATITGITVTVRRQVSSTAGGSSVDDQSVRLVKANAVTGSDYASGTDYTTAWVNASYGSGTDLWGTSWTPAEINAANFGVAFATHKTNTASGSRTARVDVIRVAVTYTTDTTPPTVASILRADADPTAGASSVSWTVTFSEAVTNVDTADFSLVQAGGVSGATLGTVTGSGTTWTVSASTGTGTGTLGLNLVDNDSIVDGSGNRLGGTGANNGNYTGQVYTISAFVCSPPANIPAGLTVSCVCDNFNRASLDPSTIFGQNWITSNSDGTTVLPTIAGSTALRLTDNTTYKAKSATVPAAFPAAGNYISVEFNHYAYNGSGADGIAVTLSDYSVPAVPGAYGGSLGYAQQTTIDGFAGGWIGVALDEYGNYQNATEGRSGGPGFRQDSVGIRGSGSGRATGQYPWVAGTAANLSPGIDNAGSTARAPGHRYQIVVDARNAGAAPAQTMVGVNRDTSGAGTSYASLISAFNIYTANPAQAAVPANWQISFTGSTGASTNIHEIDSLRICASTIVPPTGGVASGFAVIDEAYGTPAIAVQNYLTGRVFTKVAGTPFKLNIAAINNNQIQTGYVGITGSKNVEVKLVDNSNSTASDYCVLNSTQTNYCSASCRAKAAVTGGTQTLNYVYANAGQKQSADFTIPGAWSNLVAIVSETAATGTTSACSTDAFAVRPLNFNAVSSTANNTALTSTPALRAGSDTFSITVGTATDGYAGAPALPTINSAGVAATAGWTVGSLAGSFSAATSPLSDSSATGTAFTYSEVGHFRFLGYDPASNTSSPRGIYDSTWTAVDQSTSDCIAGSYANTRDTSGTLTSNTNYGKFGCLFGLSANSAFFGRFIPHHFALRSTTSPVTPAISPTCNGTSRNFTYMGQSALRVAYQLEARNGLTTPSRTLNYDANLYGASTPPVSLPAPTLVAENPDHAGCNLSSRLSSSSNARWSAGIYDATVTTATPATTTTASAVFSRPGSATPVALDAAQCSSTRTNAGGPFWNMELGVVMVDGTASTAPYGTMNPDTTGDCTLASPVATCTALKLGNTGIVLGRLNLLNAYGSDALPLLVPVRAEYWNGSSWQLNSDDRCTTLSATNLAMGNVAPASGSSLNVTSADLTMSPSATMSGGLTNFRINPVATARGPGSVDLVLNLGFGVDSAVDWCGSWPATGTHPVTGTGSAPSPELSFLAGNWCGSNADRAPAARVRFGSPRVPFIYLRERY